MYKSKIQELCHRNSWSLPAYSTAKVGPDHNPRFSATVTVNGVPFQTVDRSQTAKEAENKAAKIAFDHFSTPNRPTHIPRSHSFQASITTYNINPLSGGGTSKPTTTNLTLNTLVNETPEVEKFIDVQHSYKSKLQNYAQRRKLTPPVYSSEREGPLHASRFKSKVMIDGKSYGSLELFPMKKDAEQAAAKVALESLDLEMVQEDDSGLYKNLIQQLAHKSSHAPKYKTTVSGPPQKPIFISTVEIGGKSFQGQASKRKRQAEDNAAKLAYSSFRECYQSDQARQIRGSPHLEGNYTLLVYVPVHIPSTATKELAQLLKKVSSHVPGLKAIGDDIPLNILHDGDLKVEQVTLGREFHISLGRTVHISLQQIDSVVSNLRKKLQFQRQMYWIDFSKLEVFVNDHRKRSFLSIEVTTRGLAEITEQIAAVDEVYKLHNLPEYYKDPHPHVSIAWASGNVRDLLKEAIAEETKKYSSFGGYVQKPIFTCRQSRADVKTLGRRRSCTWRWRRWVDGDGQLLAANSAVLADAAKVPLPAGSC
ncbi:uncharacterized protein LOC127790229 isoform X2 [Diospyros lotus]|uniref:uncharacterized protein LOC127790229 isoform X2 n=1 Tax=Diospyros lotus TaxID=55363 RepID=UPI00225AC81E|nr:uncharacterized protein LOC127790229 isoform X2 [Diospyros lotus]